MVLQLRLLGGFEARLPSGQTVEISGKKNQALMAFLALNADKKLPREKLADLLWSDRGSTQARSSLRQALGTLRRDLDGIDPEPLIIDADSLGGDASALSIDVVEFERLAASAKVDDLRRAAALYAGDLVDGLVIRDPAFEEWLSFERTRLRDMAIAVLDKLSAQLAGAERIAAAKRLVALDPVREDSHRALMRAYAAHGHADQAIRQYNICRDTLKRELQVEPSTETERLHRQIVEARQANPNAAVPMASMAEAAVPPIPSAESLPSGIPIAVLPFGNMTGDPAQDYFSAGITEDIITDLSKVSKLNVVARNAVLAFKDNPVDIRQIARQLQVDFVLEGSVRRAGGRVRITSQLIDGKNASHVWAERYDRDLNDIFALQDEISQAIVASLRVKLLPDEKQAIISRSTLNPDAYELYLQARHYLQQRGARNLEAALRFCDQALEIDPDYSRALASVALCRSLLYIRGRSVDSGLAAAEKAIAIDPSLAEAYAAKGRALAELGRGEEALAAHEISLRLDPGSFDVQYYLGRSCLQFGTSQSRGRASGTRRAAGADGLFAAGSCVAKLRIAGTQERCEPHGAPRPGPDRKGDRGAARQCSRHRAGRLGPGLSGRKPESEAMGPARHGDRPRRPARPLQPGLHLGTNERTGPGARFAGILCAQAFARMDQLDQAGQRPDPAARPSALPGSPRPR